MADVGKFLGSLVSGAASPASALADSAAKIIGMFKLSPEVKAELQAKLTEENVDLEKAQLAAEVASVTGQLEINKQEAASTNWFIAGWRPAVGWVCVFALFYANIVQPFAGFLLIAFKVKLLGPLPTIDSTALTTGLLLPMLGIAGFRTIEKVTKTEDQR